MIENAGLTCPQNKILFWVIASWAWETIASFHREFSYCSCPGFSWDRGDFFIVSGMMVCFGYRRKTMLTNQCPCWAALYRAKDVSISVFRTSLQADRLRRHKKVGGDRTRTDDLNWRMNIKYQVGHLLCIYRDILLLLLLFLSSFLVLVNSLNLWVLAFLSSSLPHPTGRGRVVKSEGLSGV